MWSQQCRSVQWQYFSSKDFWRNVRWWLHLLYGQGFQRNRHWLEIILNSHRKSRPNSFVTGTKRSIKDLVQWVREMIRTNQNHSTVPPPILDTALLTQRYKTHKTFTHIKTTISDAAKPSRLTTNTNWDNWILSFLKFLRTIPSRNGVPLDYVCRKNITLNRSPQTNILIEYVQ